MDPITPELDKPRRLSFLGERRLSRAEEGQSEETKKNIIRSPGRKQRSSTLNFATSIVAIQRLCV